MIKSPTTRCEVPECDREAAFGDDWPPSNRSPLVAFRLGIELRLEVRDLAVLLALCEAHADELTTLAWTPVLQRLESWKWTPLG